MTQLDTNLKLSCTSICYTMPIYGYYCNGCSIIILMYPLKDTAFRCFMSLYLCTSVLLFKALHLGMTTPDYAWISFGWYFDKFWEDSYENRTTYDPFNHCTPSELERIVDQMILIDLYPRQDDKDSDVIIGELVSVVPLSG